MHTFTRLKETRMIETPQPLRRPDGRLDFSAFYAEHAGPVLIYLARRCLDPEVAVDLMAETFARAFANRVDYRGTTEEEASAWVFAIARHQLADYFRRGKARQEAVRRLGLTIGFGRRWRNTSIGFRRTSNGPCGCGLSTSCLTRTWPGAWAFQRTRREPAYPAVCADLATLSIKLS